MIKAKRKRGDLSISLSVLLFAAGIGVLIIIMLVTNYQFRQPQYAGEAGWGPLFEFFAVVVFIVIPLLLASLITGIVGVRKKRSNRNNTEKS